MPATHRRHIPFEGPVNFRDIGGYVGTLGTVVWGRVYRSDTLALTDADLEPFAALGIRTVFDMRGEIERKYTPNRFPSADPPAVLHMPLVSEDPADNPLAGISSPDGEDFLEHLYLHILERSARNFGRLLSGLATEEELPAVFHCSAGKDRTGLVSGVLLSILGIPLETILDDYEMTGLYRTTEHVQATMDRLGEAQNLPPEVVAGMLRTPRWAMRSALTQVAERYDGFESYLTGPAGAAPDVPDRLRRTLLTP